MRGSLFHGNFKGLFTCQAPLRGKLSGFRDNDMGPVRQRFYLIRSHGFLRVCIDIMDDDRSKAAKLENNAVRGGDTFRGHSDCLGRCAEQEAGSEQLRIRDRFQLGSYGYGHFAAGDDFTIQNVFHRKSDLGRNFPVEEGEGRAGRCSVLADGHVDGGSGGENVPVDLRRSNIGFLAGINGDFALGQNGSVFQSAFHRERQGLGTDLELECNRCGRGISVCIHGNGDRTLVGERVMLRIRVDGFNGLGRGCCNLQAAGRNKDISADIADGDRSLDRLCRNRVLRRLQFSIRRGFQRPSLGLGEGGYTENILPAGLAVFIQFPHSIGEIFLERFSHILECHGLACFRHEPGIGIRGFHGQDHILVHQFQGKLQPVRIRTAVFHMAEDNHGLVIPGNVQGKRWIRCFFAGCTSAEEQDQKGQEKQKHTPIKLRHCEPPGIAVLGKGFSFIPIVIIQNACLHVNLHR